MRLFKRLFATALALGTFATAATADSYWNHNGSVMRLEAYGGNGRAFYYAMPRQGMVNAGVHAGTMLFNGVREGDRYRGTARIFSRQCGALDYYITGRVVSETRVVLEGQRPVFRDCLPTGQTTYDRLVFDYQYSD